VLYRVACRWAGDPIDAEDLVSETLLLAAKNWGKFDGQYPRSWLIRIMKNRQIRRQAKGRVPTVPLETGAEVTDGSNIWQDLSTRVIAEKIVSLLEKLPDEYRSAVELCDVEGFDYQEAAAALDVPLGTIRSRLYRGRRMLRELLGPIEGGTTFA
jgi:RNA polymerase sigma-70 factor (ECF subfamily)